MTAFPASESTTIHPAQVRFGDRVQIDDVKTPPAPWLEAIIDRYPTGWVRHVHEKCFQVRFDNGSAAWFSRRSERLVVTLKEG